MPIISLTDAKVLLQIAPTDTTNDSLISALIKLVQSEVVRYCNNSFLMPTAQSVLNSNFAETITFHANTPGGTPAVAATITDSASGFVTAGLHSGYDVKVYGSQINDGIYLVTTVAAGVLTLDLGETLFDEIAGADVTIQGIRWPKDIVIPVVNRLRYHMEKSGKLVKSETLPGGYSVTYKDGPDVMSGFDLYRKPYR